MFIIKNFYNYIIHHLHQHPMNLLEYVYLYCNTILPQHQTTVDQLEGMITVEDRP